MRVSLKGFSLVELLVAMAIMSMTILISSMGYGFFMEKWDGELGDFDLASGNAKKLLMVKQAISNVYPYVLRTADNTPVFYFEGTTDSFVGVAKTSLTNSDFPSVIRVSVGQADDFSYFIRYEEAVLNRFPLVSLKQQLPFDRQMALLSGLTAVQIEYFGFENQDARAQQGQRQWWTSFNSLQRGVMPSAIRLLFVLNDQQQSIVIPVSEGDPRILRLFTDEV